jgi:superfamily I DNA/RNA helicase
MSSVQGYFCYDEMFVWASDLLDKAPSVVEVLRNRFPILFIDETQDNSEDQSAILNRIFMYPDTAVIRQRFGDANQAIFNSVRGKGAENDKFPVEQIKADLPNSHRFGQTIATLADPFAIVPCGLKGQGPKKKFLDSGEREGRHTIFLFNPANANKVLDAYGELLLETFSDQELRDGSFWAVGLVHRPPVNDKKEDHKLPHHIGDYWPDYEPELSKQDPKLESFVQFVMAGMAKARMAGEAFPAVEKIAQGILRLAGMAESGITLHERRNCHRYVLQLLGDNGKARKHYDAIINRFIVRGDGLTNEVWNADRPNRRRIVKEIAESVAKCSLAGPEVENFLAWPGETHTPKLPAAREVRDNIYVYRKIPREVAIQVGSIHSVKGKTHTSTLVLETFWNAHNLEKLRPWIVSPQMQAGWKNSDGVEQETRLKIQYVAMTRPTHLLCLAMKRSTFEKDGILDQEVMEMLDKQGWKMNFVNDQPL